MLRLREHACVWQVVKRDGQFVLQQIDSLSFFGMGTNGWYLAMPSIAIRDSESYYLTVTANIKDALSFAADPEV